MTNYKEKILHYKKYYYFWVWIALEKRQRAQNGLYGI
jgi:hypothetical protein